ncbi:UDP-2,4-diacetamido-2,4,6-trideoxy-beta-L-altropyranose hydrolase [Marinobacter sp.]|uniref:UDP-2,4-diacetamido-2,4, 6-trideoxy-beta-L-altropyranose hydrolase n=1 Tax=Marinobacter sp. TaxID=50741 RepID=UPI003A93BA51
MNIAFRADASIEIGTGHVMRCLTLADELTRQGHECQFICREHRGHLGELISSKGYELTLLPAATDTELDSLANGTNAYADWLGVSWQQDAEQTIEALASLSADWLVVDHYALDARWEQQLANVVNQIMVIDDLADREHKCSLLLDQNVLGAKVQHRYEAKVNKTCRLLLGPRYALLRPEYGLMADVLPERDGNISRVLIFVGGSDPYHLTERYLHALDAPEFDHLFVDVVMGKNHSSPEMVKQLVAKRAKARLYAGLPSLAALMVRADLMLGAGGATNWERMCLGLNSVVVSVARNQDDINRELESQALISFVGNAEGLDVDSIREAMQFVLESPKHNQGQSIAMRRMVDGHGAQHVAQQLQEVFCSVSA